MAQIKVDVPDFYDDTEIKNQIAQLSATLKKVDSEAISKRLSNAEKLIERLTKLASQTYDDTAIKKSIKLLSELAKQQFDDTSLRKRINNVEKKIPNQYDDKWIKKQLTEIKSSIPEQFNDSAIKNQIEGLKDAINSNSLAEEMKEIRALIPGKFDDKSLVGSIAELNSAIESVKSENTELRSVLASIQKEVRSNRKESGFKIDTIDQKLNRLTEIK